MRTLIFGDVHGCLYELRELINRFKPQKDDLVISAGDLIDKGPDPQGVLQFAAGLGMLTVMGNHDEKLRRFIKYMWANKPERAAKIKRADELYKLYSDIPAWVQQYVVDMPTYYRDPSGFCVVHGGIEPVCQKMPYEPKESKTLAKAERGALWTTKWVRYIRQETGRMIPMGDEGPEDPFWADIYDGRFGTAYFGHQPFINAEPPKFKHAVALDTGCVFGGHLTGAVLVDGKLKELIKVKAREKYCDPAKYY